MNAIVLTDRLLATPIAPSNPILSVSDLHVRFGDVAVIEGLNLTVRRREFMSLLGPSGCGKSTLLKVVAGLVQPASGTLVKADSKLRAGFMFQKPLLLPWRTVLDNVLLPIEIQRGGNAVSNSDRIEALRVLDLVRLRDFGGSYPHQLSGGMQQRTALARTLMGDPDILLLDEPFSALDELTRDILNDELIRIWQSDATRLSTIMMVTHSIPEAVTMADRVVLYSKRPARLLADIPIHAPRPRVPEQADSAAIIRDIRDIVRAEQ